MFVFFKEIIDDEEAVGKLTEQLNEWWEEREQIPDDMLKARVALIFKSGSTKLISNYRPISLLNTTIKMFAAILKQRISDRLDRHLHKTHQITTLDAHTRRSAQTLILDTDIRHHTHQVTF